MTQLSCKKLCLGYDGHEIVHNLNFSVEKGDYLCILGENGSGKSTLMRTILGLQPPMGGKVVFDEEYKSGGIGYLPQQTVVQRDFPASVWEIVLSGCQKKCGIRPFYGKSEKALANENIEKMGLTKLKKRCYRELSGGQQQRVLLCRALCAANELLILDEPVTGLDPAASQDLYKTLRYLHDKENMAILMVTHDVGAALREAKTILHIGQKHWFYGTTEEYLRDESGRRFGK